MDRKTLHRKLIKSALAGKQAAFRQLYDLHNKNLFLVCLRYAKDRSTAQDYLQDAFVNIFKNLHQFDSERGVFEAWAKRITVNACLGDIRKNTLYSVSIAGAEYVESEEVGALSQLSLQEMLTMIQQLPYGYKTIFNLYVIDGFSHKEIAAQLDISISTSKTQLMKARNLLQKKITLSQYTYSKDHG